MIKRLLLISFALFIFQTSFGQTLKPSIGLASLPADGDIVCNIPVYTGDFNSSGFQAGDTIPHFKLYDKNGTATDVLTVLQTGKPLLLVAGSYTCPVFRQKIAKINQVVSSYGTQINVYVVYVVEAHPKNPDLSPYSGTVWTTSENQQESILYLQPTTYGERKQIINDMLANGSYQLTASILIDGPCNEWWLNFGPAPNNAYLIKPDGVIYKKHGWFDKNPDNIATDINSLLGSSTGIKEFEASKVLAYPNPSNSGVTFDLSPANETVNIQLVDAVGKIVFNMLNVNDKIFHLNTSNLPNGLYTYRITGNKFSSAGKLILQ
jgi:hypothetical protein